MTFTMQGRLSACALLVYRTPVDRVRDLVPRPLELMTIDGQAFWAVVLCRVQKMRPLGVPSILGISYTHVAHRLYVRTPDGQSHGLFFLRSDVSSRLIAAGDWCTDFRMHLSRIDLSISPKRWDLRVRGAPDAEADVSLDLTRPFTCEKSMFASPDEALARLKYSPQGLALARRAGAVRLAEVFRDESQWHETPVCVERARFAFMDRSRTGDAVLETATTVEPVDYRWRLGRTENAIVARQWVAPAR